MHIMAVFLVASASQAIVALSYVFRSFRATGIGRLDEIGVVWLSENVAAVFGVEVWRVVPVWSHAFELSLLDDLLSFAATAVVFSGCLTCCYVIAATPLVVLLRRCASFNHIPRNELYVTVTLAVCLPEVLRATHAALSALVVPAFVKPGAVLTTLVICGVSMLALRWILRSERVVDVGLQVMVGGGMTAAALVVAGAMVVGYSGRESGARVSSLDRPPLPNLMLISIDSLRADHLHCYGYTRETSPVMDRIAEEGARFETVVAASSWTLPTHISMLTALPPEAHGVVRDGLRLPDEVLSLAQVLHDAGYTTSGFVSGPYLDATYGFMRGFEHYDDFSIRKGSTLHAHRWITGPALASRVTEYLTRWDEGGRERPFFVFLHLWDVHYDFIPPSPYDKMFDPDYQGGVTGKDFKDADHIHRDMAARDLEHLVALYDGEIRFVDSSIGKVTDALRALGVYEDTVLVLTADHGEEFFEHGRKGHRKALYEESIRVPLIVRYPPKVPAARVVRSLVRQIDLAPTLLSLAGLPIPVTFGGDPLRRYAGQDLTSVMTSGHEQPSEPIAAFSELHGDDVAIRYGRYKLIRYGEPGRIDQLFELTADPGESTNLIDERSDVVRTMDTMLSERIGFWQRAKQDPAALNVVADQQQQLRALGYIE